ncbi:hypothetical protein [Pontibacter sp. SGAir0037]|uniref:hypothetical protein n=1 Tax=Pontibacter sp. SGAir0037 TaxID=2571030 RepID=UPI0010CD6248|nr:hypothetical protein [Pontibacter sp. SGAir0037]QCR23759.1 hypothetical protein C1N53_16335 [Pontibacter sp. SGAir0037]
MPILNYTTKVPATKTVGEIQEVLAKAGASKIMIDYIDREPVAVSFLAIMQNGTELSFRLPCDWEGVLAALGRDKVERKFLTPEHAKMVAWRTVKQWVEAQLAFIEAEQATMAQVFLPYAVTSTGETMYDRLINDSKRLLT